MVVKPIQKSSAAGKVFDILYDMIATGQFQPGQKLPSQDELAKQLGVSRNTLREAINKLSAMGLLSSHQGIGTVVESPHPAGYLSTLSGQFLLDPLSVREFIEARICIERTAVRLAVARAGDDDIRRLHAIIEGQQLALKKGDSDEFTKKDAEFHMELAEVSGNRVLMKFLQTIHDRWHRFIEEVAQLPGAVQDALHFHLQVTKALAAKDADKAEQELVSHLFDVVRRIESNLHIDLNPKTMYGFNLLRLARPRRKIRSVTQK